LKKLKDLYCRMFEQHKPLAVHDAIWQCSLETGENYYLRLHSGQLEFGEGRHAHATLTLYFTSTEIPVQIAAGKLDPMAAFLNGDFRSDSHLLLVMYYLMLFGPLAANADLR